MLRWQGARTSLTFSILAESMVHIHYPLPGYHLTSYGPQWGFHMAHAYIHLGISLGAMPPPTALAGLPTISDPVGTPPSTGHRTRRAYHHYLEWAVTHYPGATSPDGWKLATTEFVDRRSHHQCNQWQQYDKPAPACSISCTTPYGGGLRQGKPPTSAPQAS